MAYYVNFFEVLAKSLRAARSRSTGRPVFHLASVQGGLQQHQLQNVSLTFIGNGKCAVAVAFEITKEHAAFFGAAHIFLKFLFRDCVKRLFAHAGFSSTQRKDGTRPKTQRVFATDWTPVSIS